MKNITTFFSKLRFWVLSLLAMITCSVASAQGSGTMYDPYIMEDGGEYPFAVYKNFYGQFIVPEDVSAEGVVLEILADNWTDIFADAELTQLVSETTGNFAPYTSTVKIPVGTKKGTIYYVFSDFPMNSGSVKVTYGGGTPLGLSSVVPAQGSVLAAAESNIGIEFTKPVRFSSCVMMLNGKEVSVVANQVDRFVSIEPKAQLLDAYRSGVLKEGDAILFVLKNVTSLDGNTKLGDVVIDYKAAMKPVMLVSSEYGSSEGTPVVKSWMPVEGKEGLLKLMFDGALNPEAEIIATLTFGNSETEDPNEYYVENITPTFEGNTILLIDLRGKLRTPQNMVTSGTNYGSMLLTIRGVEDAEGHMTYADGQGTAGAYFFDFAYEVVEYSLFTEFTPASGSSIDDVATIELWMQELGGKLTYKGVDFEYTYEGVKKVASVSATDIKSEVDPEDETALCLTIPVPTFSRDADTEVTLTFKNVSTPDGSDYSVDLTAVYTTKGFTDPSGIGAVTLDAAKGAIFTLDGKRIEASKLVKNTVYVVAGKKAILK